MLDQMDDRLSEIARRPAEPMVMRERAFEVKASPLQYLRCSQERVSLHAHHEVYDVLCG